MRRLYLRCWPPSCRSIAFSHERERELERDQPHQLQSNGAVGTHTEYAEYGIRQTEIDRNISQRDLAETSVCNGVAHQRDLVRHDCECQS